MQTNMISDVLVGWAATPFVWGESDCGLSVADYVLGVVGRDPAVDMRGKYDTRRSCYQWVKQTYGTVLNMAHEGFRSAGLMYTDDPEMGDVGVVKFAGTHGQVIALCVGKDLWAARMLDGCHIQKGCKVVKAWRVSCPQ